jgi:hypothetical protein
VHRDELAFTTTSPEVPLGEVADLWRTLLETFRRHCLRVPPANLALYAYTTSFPVDVVLRDAEDDLLTQLESVSSIDELEARIKPKDHRHGSLRGSSFEGARPPRWP